MCGLRFGSALALPVDAGHSCKHVFDARLTERILEAAVYWRCMREASWIVGGNFKFNSINHQLGSYMKNTLQTLLIGTVLALGAGGLAWAAEAADPVVGTWSMDIAKSKFHSAPAPKSQTRTYVQTADGISLTVTGVAADGSSVSQQSTFKYDGKNYAITGSPDYEMIALKRVNGTTVRSEMMKGGKHVGVTTRSVSDHGKVLTLTTRGKNAAGKHYDMVTVFDKQ